MTKLTKLLIDENSNLSSSRWGFVTCIKFACAISLIGIIGFFVLIFLDKEIPSGYLGGLATLVGVILGVSGVQKSSQSFAEYGNHYFDKPTENTTIENVDVSEFEDK